MPPESPQASHKPIIAFGSPQTPFPSDPVHSPDAAAVLAESVSYFSVLLRTNQNFLFRFRRDQLSKLNEAIAKVLHETAPEAH